MDRARTELLAAFVLVATIAAAPLIGCGGDGGGPNPPAPNPAPGPTRFRGNLARMIVQRQASTSSRLAARIPLTFASQADAQETGVPVCIEGTTFCSSTDDSGQFVLVAPVSGNIVLIFRGVDFTARLLLTGIPMGAVVTIRNINCSTSSGQCAPQQLDVEAPMPAGAPLANQLPDCTLATASPAVLSFPPNHQMVAIFITGVTDPDGDEVMVTPTAVSQDEPVLGVGSGNTEPDATLNPLAVRAERSGEGNGRVYTVSFVANDAHGESCSGSVRVCVPHDQRPGATCIDDGPTFDSTV